MNGDNVMFLSELSNGLALRSRCVRPGALRISNHKLRRHGNPGLVIQISSVESTAAGRPGIADGSPERPTDASRRGERKGDAGQNGQPIEIDAAPLSLVPIANRNPEKNEAR